MTTTHDHLTTVNTIQAGIRGTSSRKVQEQMHLALGAYVAGDYPQAEAALTRAQDMATGRTTQVMARVALARIAKGK